MAGSTRYSANASGLLTPIPYVLLHRCRLLAAPLADLKHLADLELAGGLLDLVRLLLVAIGVELEGVGQNGLLDIP